MIDVPVRGTHSASVSYKSHFYDSTLLSQSLIKGILENIFGFIEEIFFANK